MKKPISDSSESIEIQTEADFCDPITKTIQLPEEEAKGAEPRDWYLRFPGGDPMGPFSASEIHAYVFEGVFDDFFLAWRKGCPDWEPLSAYAEFAGLAEYQKSHCRRVHPRAPIRARVGMDIGGVAISGHCLDISCGGIRIELDAEPDFNEEMVEITIVPAEPSISIPSFHVKAEIVWAGSGGREIALQFKDLPERDARQIGRFIAISCGAKVESAA